MSRLVLLTVFLLSLTAIGVGSPPDRAARPNVLFIAVDDLNDWVGFLGGHPQALTPNMDRLAARGVVFTNAHCASPACNPSRAAIFSGQMPWRTGVWSNRSPKFFTQNPKQTVLPQSFATAGYATYGTGKLMHSGAAANRRMFDRHFNVEQRWSPFTRSSVRYTPEEAPSKGTSSPQHLVRLNGEQIILPLNGMPSDRNPGNREGESFDWGPLAISDAAMGDTQITDWAIQQMASHAKEKESPFFLGVGYYRPHIPLFAPAKYFERFRDNPGKLPPIPSDDLTDLSEIGKKWALEADTGGKHATVVKYNQWRAAVEAYLACTTFVDGQIGRLIDALDRGEFGQNTVIVLWTDHGWHLGEKQHWGKWTGWERSTRVPLIVVPPARLASQFAEGGSRCDQPVSLIDLYPTLVDLCQLQSPGQLDGESLVPLLEDPDRQTDRTALTVFDPGNVTVRDDRWRLIRYADGSRELYDLKSDPNEWVNRAGDPETEAILERLKEQIPPEALSENGRGNLK